MKKEWIILKENIQSGFLGTIATVLGITLILIIAYSKESHTSSMSTKLRDGNIFAPLAEQSSIVLTEPLITSLIKKHPLVS